MATTGGGADPARVDEECAVVVVDDHPGARRALSGVVAATPGLALAATLDSGEAAVHFAHHAVSPLLVVLDVEMPGLGGIAAARDITALGHGHVVVLVSADDDISWQVVNPPQTTFLSKSRVTGVRLHDAWRAARPT